MGKFNFVNLSSPISLAFNFNCVTTLQCVTNKPRNLHESFWLIDIRISELRSRNTLNATTYLGEIFVFSFLDLEGTFDFDFSVASVEYRSRLIDVF